MRELKSTNKMNKFYDEKILTTIKKMIQPNIN